jgi:hypothetical protein
MKNQQTIETKLSYLYDELYKIEDFTCEMQREFLLNELDYWKTELLKIKTAEKLKEIDDEANKN